MHHITERLAAPPGMSVQASLLANANHVIGAGWWWLPRLTDGMLMLEAAGVTFSIRIAI